MKIETAAGFVEARVMDDYVGITLTAPKEWLHDQAIQLETGASLTLDSLNTGVPHAVMIVDDIRNIDLIELGAAIRHHARFQPAGSNVNFATAGGHNTLHLRTYERGVEGETLACGTGVAAAALVAARKGLVHSPVEVHTAGGYTLSISYEQDDDQFDNVRLTGPAEYVCEGMLTYPKTKS
jgi:diaminopimelate epimerase